MGGLTSSSINFRIRSIPSDSSRSVQLVVSTTTPDLSSDVVFQEDLVFSTTNTTVVENADGSAVAASDDGGSDMVFHVTATGLSPNTLYYYGVVSTTSTDATTEIQASGSFRTAPIEGQRSNFKFVSSACAWTGSEASVFETLYQRQIGGTDIDGNNDSATSAALFFLHLGDFHYGDLTTDSVQRRVEEIDTVLASQKQRSLWSNIPIAYMWDDHDWLDNNSGGDPSQPGFDAALRSYTLAFPHYEPLPSKEWNSKMYQNNNMTSTVPALDSEPTTVGMYHAFTIGTVRFIVSDLRSEATNGHIYSSIQRDWLFEELQQSAQYDYVVWASTKPWNGEREDGSDTWAGYDDDRRELSNHIDKVVTKRNLLAVSADAHMIAFDDGSHTYYGGEDIGGSESSIIEGKESFPILQTGPLE